MLSNQHDRADRATIKSGVNESAEPVDHSEVHRAKVITESVILNGVVDAKAFHGWIRWTIKAERGRHNWTAWWHLISDEEVKSVEHLEHLDSIIL